MVQITTKELKELLETAFDKGWMGYCDLKEVIVQELLDRYKDQETKAESTKGYPLFDGHVWVGPDWSAVESAVLTSGTSGIIPPNNVWTTNIIDNTHPPENSN